MIKLLKQFSIINLNIMLSNKYIDILEDYDECKELIQDFSELQFNNDTYCISLSGGVDSMVLMNILYHRNKTIIAIHMNYNNRKETKLEEDFLREYCYNRNIIFICHSFDITRGTIKRNDYEIMTKEVKFELYKKILQKYNLDGILLAHHKDDIIENIFTNFCRGNNFLNLSVIKESNTIMGVNIIRPLIKYYKQDIYNYAHYNKIPYFLDTTPDWSVRGKFRRKIIPQLFDTFTGLKTNLLSIAKESDEWSLLIQEKIINKYLNLIVFDCEQEQTQKQIKMPIEGPDNENYKNYPFCFWQEIFSKILHKYNVNAPSRKTLLLFIKALQNNNNNNKFTKILFKSQTYLIISDKTIYCFI